MLSPVLFNVYSEDIIKEEEGITINGGPINNLRFADNTVLIGECLEHVQKLVDNVVAANEEKGLTLNSMKTKFIIVTKTQQQQENVKIKNKLVNRLKNTKYLGAIVNEINDYS